MTTLHIYAQEMWHDEAYIAGQREDLEMLRAAIDRALNEGHGQMQAFCCDGEGYEVHVLCVSDAMADKLATPYTDEMANGGKQPPALWPWDWPWDETPMTHNV